MMMNCYVIFADDESASYKFHTDIFNVEPYSTSSNTEPRLFDSLKMSEFHLSTTLYKCAWHI